MTYTSMVHRIGNVPMLTLTGPRGKLDLSQGQCAAIAAMVEMHNQQPASGAPLPRLDGCGSSTGEKK